MRERLINPLFFVVILTQVQNLKFPNIVLLIVIGVVFWLFLLQLALGVAFSSYNLLIFVLCAIGIAVALVTTGSR